MSIDYKTQVVYGFKLDSVKLKAFEEGYRMVIPDFNIFAWMNEKCEGGNCEFFVDNSWAENIALCDVYFGIGYENRLNVSLMVELEADRRDEVLNDFIKIMGDNRDSAEFMLGKEEELNPTFYAFTRVI